MNKSYQKPKFYETLILQHFLYSNGRSRTHKCKNQSLVTLPFRLRWNVNLLLIHGDRYRCPSPTYIGLLYLFSRSRITRLCYVRNSQKIFSSARTRTQTTRTRILYDYQLHNRGMNERLFIRTILFDFHHLVTS